MTTLSFQDFWAWLQQHPNCVVQVGTPDVSMFDDDDLHWYIGPDRGALVVQAIRGKRLMGELLLDQDRVTYVQEAGEEEEGRHLFEAIAETSTDRVALYHFVLSHSLAEDEQPGHRPSVH
ncbi:MAG: hypothetical protein R2991_08440 [Thermoanaerobaculia bacterium]